VRNSPWSPTLYSAARGVVDALPMGPPPTIPVAPPGSRTSHSLTIPSRPVDASRLSMRGLNAIFSTVLVCAVFLGPSFISVDALRSARSGFHTRMLTDVHCATALPVGDQEMQRIFGASEPPRATVSEKACGLLFLKTDGRRSFRRSRGRGGGAMVVG
jgi:hypothetical protein